MIIATDLDGTLLNSQKEISNVDYLAIEKAVNQGAIFVPTTGRPLNGISEKIRSLDFVKYFITCNGAAIYEKNTGKCVCESPIPNELSLEILDILSPYDISINAFINGYSHRQKSVREIIEKMEISPQMMNYMLKSGKWVDDLYLFIKDNNYCVHKFTLDFREKDGEYLYREEVKKIIEKDDRLTVVCGGLDNLEITLNGIDKGYGLKKLCEYLGEDINNTVAFGDSENDLAMIEAAGVGVAMGNSDKCVLDVADCVTLTNDEGGIAEYIIKNILD